jgi:hypothetical protein
LAGLKACYKTDSKAALKGCATDLPEQP